MYEKHNQLLLDKKELFKDIFKSALILAIQKDFKAFKGAGFIAIDNKDTESDANLEVPKKKAA